MEEMALTEYPDCGHADEIHVEEGRKSLGEGSYAVVRSACLRKYKKCDYALKMMKLRLRDFDKSYVQRVFLAESMISDFASKQGIGVPLYKYYLCGEGERGVIVFEKYENTMLHLKQTHQITFEDVQTIINLAQKLHGFGILHRDLFLKNVMYKTGNNNQRIIRLNDFGLSIAFGQEIPEELCCLDIVNIVMDLEGSSLQPAVKTYARSLYPKVWEKCWQWKENHYHDCSSEYFLFEKLPDKLFEIYGPATIDLLVWSVRCNVSHDNEIVAMVEQKSRDLAQHNKYQA
jgi:serine/threonine protein kinase